MSAQNIPSEILDQIFTLVHEDTLPQCLLVCKSWHISALAAFYSTLHLDEQNFFHEGKYIYIHAYIKKHCHLIKTVKPRKSLRLKCHYKYGAMMTLLNCLSHLTVLDLTNTRDVENFLETIKGHLVCAHNLSCLQQIKIPDKSSKPDKDSYLTSLYIQTCFKLSSSIRYIELRCTNNDFINDYLPSFPKLNYLKFYNFSEKEKKLSSLVFSRIMNKCPNLIEFFFYNQPFKKDPNDTKKKKEIELQAPPLSFNRINPNIGHYNQNLKKLEIFSYTFDTTLMQYYISYIPTSQLDKISIILNNHDTLNEWIKIETNEKDIMSKFLRHLSHAKLIVLGVTHYYSDIREPTHDEIIQVNQLPWKIINKMDKKKPYYLQFELVDDLDSSMAITLTTPPPTTSFINNSGHCFQTRFCDKFIFVYQKMYNSDFFSKRYTNNPILSLIDLSTADATSKLKLIVPPNKLVTGLEFALDNFQRFHSVEMVVLRTGSSSNNEKIKYVREKLENGENVPKIIFVKHSLFNAQLFDQLGCLFPFLTELILINCNMPIKRCPFFILDLKLMVRLKYLDFGLNEFKSKYSKILILPVNFNAQGKYYYTSSNKYIKVSSFIDDSMKELIFTREIFTIYIEHFDIQIFSFGKLEIVNEDK